jgi:hypothetical protein
VLVLGVLGEILTGIRQPRRTRPLEIEEVEGLRVPTLAAAVRRDAAEIDLSRVDPDRPSWVSRQT